MSIFTWSDKYSVKVAEIDAQHKKLIRMADALFESLRATEGKERVVGDVLQELVNYTRMHFATEERLMAAAGYDRLAAHKQEHARLLAHVGKFVQQYNSGNRKILAQLMQFLHKWLFEHIMKTDKLYSETLCAAAAG